MRPKELFKARFSRLRIKLSASSSAKTAFIVGLLSPLVAFGGLMTAFLAALYNEERFEPLAIMTPILLIGLTVPVIFCLVGITLGIIGVKSEQRNTAIAGIVISGLTLFFGFGSLFFR
ncbi:MAG: hypothetical protein IPP66_04890 [Anaerolineales bacterium]|nr:hypothetical protein [Anaerolineales bacterium]